MFADIRVALSAYGEAIELSRKLNLWKFYFIPALISLLLAGLIGWAAFGWASNIGDWLSGWYPWERGRGVVDTLGSLMGGLLVLALGLILYKNLVMIFAGPFMSPLSEKVETHISGIPTGKGLNVAQFTSDLVRGIQIGIRNILRELLYTLILLLVGLIGIVAPITTLGIFLVQSYYAGFGNMDYTLERHYRLKGSVQFIRRHKGLAMGNGVVFMGLLLTGIGFLIAPPLSTVAATIATVRRLEQEDRPV
ncbi:MAG: EI24 domain-containing protein [Saprospiraceae bacterium]|nr:EI24 domain-containing protein [Saprospiraceae bacterium]